jgi:CheY-like chemotaxis protein
VTQHLPTILAETFDAVKSIEQKAGGSVEIRLHCANLDPDIEEIITDPYFKRVLYCLLSNAVKYSPLNGFVDVTVSNTSSMSRTRTKPNTENSSGISTPKRMSGKESFISSLPAIREKFEKDSGTPTGYFTFHIRNSTVTPMNVPETTAFFKNYYHSTARGNRLGNQSSTGSIVDCQSSGNLLEFALMDRREGSTCSKSSSNQKFNDLQQYSGLGLGLYTAYNMVSLMGGALECSVENEDEACFWFTIPALYYTSDHLNQGQEEGDGSGSGRGSGSGDQPPDDEGVASIAPTAIITTFEEIAEANPVINIIDIEAPPTGNLLLTSPVATPTPSFVRLSSTPPTSARASITEQPLDPNVLSESTRSSGSSSSGFSKQRILVVDDSRICQKVAGKALSGLEFVLDYASNGLEACVKLSEKPLRYDAVLMDLRMPIMDGITAIRKCRTELGLTKLPIIALTAEVGSSIKEEANKAGASWFLTKPAKVLELISVMRAFSFSK